MPNKSFHIIGHRSLTHTRLYWHVGGNNFLMDSHITWIIDNGPSPAVVKTIVERVFMRTLVACQGYWILHELHCKNETDCQSLWSWASFGRTTNANTNSHRPSSERWIFGKSSIKSISSIIQEFEKSFCVIWRVHTHVKFDRIYWAEKTQRKIGTYTVWGGVWVVVICRISRNGESVFMFV